LEGGDGLRAHLPVDVEGAGDLEIRGRLRAGRRRGLLGGLGVLLGGGLGLLRLRLLLLGLLGEAVLVAVVGDAVAVAAPVALGLAALALGRAVRLLLGLARLAGLVTLRGGAALGGAALGGAALVRCGRAAGVGAAAQRGAAGRPRAGALRGQDLLGHRELLALGGLVRRGGVLGPAEALPRLLGELQAAVVAVAGVDRPVTAGLAGGDLVPAGRGVRGAAGGEHAGGDDRAAGEGHGRAGEAAAHGGGVAAMGVRVVEGHGAFLSRVSRISR